MSDEAPIDEQVQWRVDDGVGVDHDRRTRAGQRPHAAQARHRIADVFREVGVARRPRRRADRQRRTSLLHRRRARRRSRAQARTDPTSAPDRAVGDAARMIRLGWQRLVASILDCEKPVVGAINGTAAGGGAQLVLACDLVVMADNARLIEVFVRRGIMPDAGGAYLLPRLVGLQAPRRSCSSATTCRPTTPDALGIANHVVPAAELAGTADGELASAWPRHRPRRHRHDEVAAQPVVRVRPSDGVRRRGLRSGAGQHGGLRRGDSVVRRTARPEFKGW